MNHKRFIRFNMFVDRHLSLFMDAVGISESECRRAFANKVSMLLVETKANCATDRLAILRNREQFVDRKKLSNGRKENPLEFIERVYPDRRLYQMCRSDLAELDNRLYRSLNQWLHSNNKKIPDDFGLPTKSEHVTLQIEAFGFAGDSPRATTASPQARAALSTYSAARYRERKRLRIAT